ncbi:glutathione S-transferase D5-like [Schistocerca gregaria]|uniref:glutathione S-transferase D5-like n=1 Tax=Schistocerca gregaria TaxID=7010 RepID=UPI00211F10E7|nr:glutathione S-transferase D5-like [Schistocerca gregaria]XP_049856667.1 glutathione S-transferase D5-like [Schistocerca gregaria]XP_049856668.1 glutathione S-transferase D5-like [Schistocerca gregaria]
MAPLTLYNHPLSPPCRLVRLVAGIIGVELKIEDVKDVYKDLKTPEMLKKSPQHTVPILEDNGQYISESRAIAMYLVSKYAKDDSLYPKDINKRVLVDQRLFFDQDLFHRIVNVFTPVFQGKQAEPSHIEKANDSLETLNRMLDGKQWLAGDHVTIADYAVANSLSALEFNPNSGVDPTKQPNVKQWLSRVESSHTKYGEVAREYREALKKVLQK